MRSHPDASTERSSTLRWAEQNCDRTSGRRRPVVSYSAPVATFDQITRHDDSEPDADIWVVGQTIAAPIAIVQPDASWPAVFEELARRIREALGDRVLELEHVGSTSVAELPAKPIIDIDLTVIDSSDEPAYVPALERVGFVLTIRERHWHEHRCLVSAAPSANLHVWSADSPEAIRHRMFRDWLRDHPDDRARYAAAKWAASEAANAAGEDMMSYNLRKQPVIREILDEMFRNFGML
jgi:GrpB-like predicted nucleotidyltransferase (UPF0157 family)